MVLNTDYRDMEPETEKMKELILLHLPSALFVDSYYVNPPYLTALHVIIRRAGGKLAYLDDIMSFAYPCDLLINYNIYGPDERKTYEELYGNTDIPIPKLALGPAYAPLRAEFQNPAPRRVEKKGRNILISTGGADGEHVGLRLAECLADDRNKSPGKHFTDFRFHFVLGAMNRDYKKIETITKNEENIVLHFNVAHMGRLMGRCDAAISAAGSTLYELCAVQTPAVTYTLADNQIPGARGFERDQILHCVGDVRNTADTKIFQRLLDEAVALADDYDRRKLISARQRALVDGNGARRIAQAALLPQKVKKLD